MKTKETERMKQTMIRPEYKAAIKKAEELGYTLRRRSNWGGAYDVFNTENERICFEYELEQYFKDKGIEI
jgi:hypothetical protein